MSIDGYSMRFEFRTLAYTDASIKWRMQWKLQRVAKYGAYFQTDPFFMDHTHLKYCWVKHFDAHFRLIASANASDIPFLQNVQSNLHDIRASKKVETECVIYLCTLLIFCLLAFHIWAAPRLNSSLIIISYKYMLLHLLLAGFSFWCFV